MPKVKKLHSTDPRTPPSQNHDGLSIGTLAGVYWAARQVLVHIPITRISTVDQFNDHLKRYQRGPEGRSHMLQLLHALEELHEHVTVLAATTLVRPSDHPLVVRQILPKGDD